MKNIIKKINIIIIFALVVVIISGCARDEIIIDLGDGWKTYYHKKIGIKVRIPNESVVTSHSDKKLKAFYTDFSKGSILRIGSAYAFTKYDAQAIAKSVEQYRRYILDNGKEYEATFSEGERMARNYVYEVNFHNLNAFISVTQKSIRSEFRTSSMNITIHGNHYVYGIDINPRYFDELHINVESQDEINKIIDVVEPYIIDVDIM